MFLQGYFRFQIDFPLYLYFFSLSSNIIIYVYFGECFVEFSESFIWFYLLSRLDDFKSVLLINIFVILLRQSLLRLLLLLLMLLYLNEYTFNMKTVTQRLDLSLEKDSIFYKLGSYGLISFSDYIFLLTVLSSEYRIKSILYLNNKNSTWERRYLFCFCVYPLY